MAYNISEKRFRTRFVCSSREGSCTNESMTRQCRLLCMAPQELQRSVTYQHSLLPAHRASME